MPEPKTITAIKCEACGKLSPASGEFIHMTTVLGEEKRPAPAGRSFGQSRPLIINLIDMTFCNVGCFCDHIQSLEKQRH